MCPLFFQQVLQEGGEIVPSGPDPSRPQHKAIAAKVDSIPVKGVEKVIQK